MLTRSIFTALEEGEKGGAMGLVKRKASECWQMSFFLEGRKVRKSTGTSNKKVAQKIYDAVRLRLAQGNYDAKLKPSMPFFDLVDEFLEKHSKVEKASYKRDKVIGDALKTYFGRTPIGEISPYDIKEWRKWRAQHVTRTGNLITKASLNRELAFMKTMFNLAVEWGWLKENSAEKVRLLRGEEKRLRILSREEITRLLEASAVYLRPILIAAISTGMRKGEVLDLKWEDVDFDNGFIRVERSKNAEARNVPIIPFLRDTLFGLKHRRRPEDFVFVREDGSRILCFKEAFRAACERAGISDLRFHDLRHTAASLLAAGGCDIITLQNILGHKSLSMTQRYAHLIPGRMEKTREIMQQFWQQANSNFGDTKLTQSMGRAAGQLVNY